MPSRPHVPSASGPESSATPAPCGTDVVADERPPAITFGAALLTAAESRDKSRRPLTPPRWPLRLDESVAVSVLPRPASIRPAAVDAAASRPLRTGAALPPVAASPPPPTMSLRDFGRGSPSPPPRSRAGRLPPLPWLPPAPPQRRESISSRTSGVSSASFSHTRRTTASSSSTTAGLSASRRRSITRRQRCAWRSRQRRLCTPGPPPGRLPVSTPAPLSSGCVSDSSASTSSSSAPRSVRALSGQPLGPSLARRTSRSSHVSSSRASLQQPRLPDAPRRVGSSVPSSDV